MCSFHNLSLSLRVLLSQASVVFLIVLRRFFLIFCNSLTSFLEFFLQFFLLALLHLLLPLSIYYSFLVVFLSLLFHSFVGFTHYYAQVSFFHQSFQVSPSISDGFFVIIYVVSNFCIKMPKYNYLLLVLFPISTRSEILSYNF